MKQLPISTYHPHLWICLVFWKFPSDSVWTTWFIPFIYHFFWEQASTYSFPSLFKNEFLLLIQTCYFMLLCLLIMIILLTSSLLYLVPASRIKDNFNFYSNIQSIRCYHTLMTENFGYTYGDLLDKALSHILNCL